jgi:hypothetical protein
MAVTNYRNTSRAIYVKLERHFYVSKTWKEVERGSQEEN